MTVVPLPIDRLVPDPAQPRRDLGPEELEPLVESVRRRGLLLPLRVRPADADGRHVIVSGHRRHAAAVAIGMTHASCVVVDGPPDEAAVLAEQLAENLHREDLSPIDEAEAFRRFLDLRGVLASRAAEELQLPPARISRALALLTLPEPVRAAVHAGRVPKDTAYYLARLPAGDDRDRLVAEALAGTLHRDVARAAKAPQVLPAEGPVRRVTCRLAGGRSLTLAGPDVRLDTLIAALEDALKEARKARGQGLDVGTLARVFKDRAAAEGRR